LFNLTTSHSPAGRDRVAPLKRQAFGLLLGMLAVICSGCGYHFAGEGQLPGGVDRLAVNVLLNRSSVSDVESTVTNALVNEIERRRRGAITKGDRAEAILAGTIDSITWDTVSHRGVNSAAERRVYVVISLALTDVDGKVLWKSARLTAEQAYTVIDGDKLATENNRRQAIDSAAQRVAEIAYQRMVDNF
jgi:outer membrane lipopolysaccharide assembly protein LptE/RlpB